MRRILFLCAMVAMCSASCGILELDGFRYNLDLLSSSVDYTTFHEGTNSTFYYNFCQEIVTQTSCTVPTPVAITSKNGNDCTPAGFLPPEISTIANGRGVKIVYTNDIDLCGNPQYIQRTATFFLYCDLATSYELSKLEEVGTCQYQFTASTKYACPIALPRATPPPQNDCCTPGVEAGCSNKTIRECVCQTDPLCCSYKWDSLCVTEMKQLGCGECKKTYSGYAGKIFLIIGGSIGGNLVLALIIWAIFRCKISCHVKTDADPFFCSKCTHSLHHSGKDNKCQERVPNTHASCECSKICGRRGCHKTAICSEKYVEYYTEFSPGLNRNVRRKLNTVCVCRNCNCRQCAADISCECKKCQCDKCAKKHVWCWGFFMVVPWLACAIILIADSQTFPPSVRTAGVVLLGIGALLGSIFCGCYVHVIQSLVDCGPKWK